MRRDAAGQAGTANSILEVGFDGQDGPAVPFEQMLPCDSIAACWRVNEEEVVLAAAAFWSRASLTAGDKMFRDREDLLGNHAAELTRLIGSPITSRLSPEIGFGGRVCADCIWRNEQQIRQAVRNVRRFFDQHAQIQNSIA